MRGALCSASKSDFNERQMPWRNTPPEYLPNLGKTDSDARVKGGPVVKIISVLTKEVRTGACE